MVEDERGRRVAVPDKVQLQQKAGLLRGDGAVLRVVHHLDEDLAKV